MLSQHVPVYLSCLGIVNALGATKEEVLDNLLEGNQKKIVVCDDLMPGQHVYVGAVEANLPPITSAYSQYDCRNNRLILAALEQIKTDVESATEEYGTDKIGVVLGSSTSGIREGEIAIQTLLERGRFPTSFHYKQQEMGSTAEFLAAFLELENIAFTVSTACSSSAKAFASAKNLIEMGLCDAVIVGGSDSLCRLTLNGFDSLELLAEKICNPFSKNRDGITIGEGAALFLMTKKPSEIELLGIGESSDAYHISSPDPEGRGAEAAINRAMADANLLVEDIDYINLHGTGTAKNDKMESRVINEIFGDEVPCSSTKPLTGHLLGAAGATEIGCCWLALSNLNKKNVLPPHVWDGQPDETLMPLNLLSRDESFQSVKRECCLSNSFAFGGNNVSVILGRST